MNKSNILRIPLELKSSFLKDPENFIRDIACISTESTRPFFKLKHKIFEIEKAAHQNPFDDKTKTFIDDFAPGQDDRYRRFMHIDLGYRHDAVGISMCHAPYFEDREMSLVYTDNIREEVVREPFIFFDFIGRIKADFGDEILLGSIREIIYEIARRGFYIALITYDGFQSVDSIQILRSQGYKIGRLSIDKTATKLILDKESDEGLVRKSTDGQILGSMQALKDVLYDNRIQIPFHKYWSIEARAAEIDYKKNKVDHPPKGSLDVVQSMAGSVYNLINNEFEYEEVDETAGEMGDDFYEDHQSNEDIYEDHQSNEDLYHVKKSREEDEGWKRSRLG